MIPLFKQHAVNEETLARDILTYPLTLIKLLTLMDKNN